MERESAREGQNQPTWRGEELLVFLLESELNPGYCSTRMSQNDTRLLAMHADARDGEGRQPRVCVIDDSVEIGELLAIALKSVGIQTQVVLTGAEGLAIIQRQTFDLLLVDLVLPDISGLKICQFCQAHPVLKDVPVIIITGHNATEETLRAFEAGAVDFISKPFELKEVLARVNSILKQRQSVRSELIAHRKEREQTQEELLRIGKAIDAASDGVCIMDRSFQPAYVNPAFDEMFGIPQGHLKSEHDLEPLFSKPTIMDAVREVWQLGKSWSGEVEMIHSTGALMTVLFRADAIIGSKEDILGSVLLFTDISQRKRLERELVFSLNNDPLTGLPNRRSFTEQLSRGLKSISADSPACLMLLDLDYFKLVGELAGIEGGDRFLREFSDFLRLRVRKQDILGRFGGDEFVVLLGNTAEAEARSIASRLLQSVQSFKFKCGDHTLFASACIGLAIAKPNLTAEDLLAQADAACHLAKLRGRNDFEIYQESSLDVRVLANHSKWAEEIQQALVENRLDLWCQPVVDARNRSVAFFEILLRMRDLTGKIILPGAFLPAAESYGLMRDLDAFVIRSAFRLLPTIGPGLFSINLSGKTVARADLADMVEEFLQTGYADPTRVIFEITESVMVQNLALARTNIERLKQLGFRFALDDFGTGFSSMRYLRDLPVDYLKLDGAFFRNFQEDKVNQSIVRSMVEVAKVLDMWTVAEYVVSDEVLRGCVDIGIDLVQGFHVGEPAPIREIQP